MSNLEERRVSFDQGPKPLNLIQAAAATAQKAPSPDPSDTPKKRGSTSGKTGKEKTTKSAKGSQSPKGSFTGQRRDSRRGSGVKVKKEVKTKEPQPGRQRSDSLFKKSDVRYKEIRRALTKRQRDQKKKAESGEKQQQEL